MSFLVLLFKLLFSRRQSGEMIHLVWPHDRPACVECFSKCFAIYSAKNGFRPALQRCVVGGMKG